ncbi:MAG: hypothetical protein ACFE9L_19200 [Candidatus Hodarchaeota archaeon]
MLSNWITDVLRLEVIHARVKMGQREIHIFYNKKNGKIEDFKIKYGYNRFIFDTKGPKHKNGFHSPYLIPRKKNLQTNPSF